MSNLYEEKRLEESFNRGVEVGIKLMMDKIQKNCLLGKPVLANDELYFFKTAQQNLIDIMDGIDREYGVQKESQYVVPMHKSFDGKCVEFKLLITAKTPYEAWCVAHAAFEYKENEVVGSWKVYPNYKEYEQLK